jgi:general secretion pathway protein G
MRSLNRFNSQAGLTLVEIVVVLIILGVVFTIVAPKVLSQGDKAKAQATRLQLKKVKNHFESFQLQYNKLPTSVQDLTGCTDKTGTGCIPLADADELKDAWGNDFRFEAQGSRYKIKSLGADGKDGGSGVDGDLIEEGP